MKDNLASPTKKWSPIRHDADQFQIRPVARILRDVLLPGFIIAFLVVGWSAVYRNDQAQVATTIRAYQQIQLAILRPAARGIELSARQSLDMDRQVLEQTLYTQLVAPVSLLQSSYAWLYASDHLVTDTNMLSPAYQAIARMFAGQPPQGASHYETLVKAVTSAQEGADWYIGSPDKGQEIVAWTPVQTGRSTWVIGLSTPLSDILETSGTAQRQRAAFFLMGMASLIASLVIMLRMFYILRERRIEKALGQTDRVLGALIHNSPLAIIALDRDQKVTLWNPSAERLFGWKAQEVMGHPYPLVPPDKWETFQTSNREMLDSRATFMGREVQGLRRDGTLIDVGLSTLLLEDDAGHVSGSIAILEDITERKQSEEALRESEARYRRLFEDAVVGIFQSTLDGKPITVNPAFARMFGYKSPGEILATIQNAADLFVDPAQRSEMLRQIAEESNLRGFENQYRRKDGSIFTGNLHVWPVSDASGRVLFIEGFVEDVTTRKQMFEALQASEAKFYQAFHTSPDSITISRLRDGVYVDINEGFTRATGYTWEEVAGKSTLDTNIWVHPADRESLLEGLQDGGEVTNLEAEFRHKDGSILVGLMSAKTIEIDGDQYILAITRDISERKKAEDNLRRSEAAERAQRALAEALRDSIAALTSTLDFEAVIERLLTNVQHVVPHDDSSIILIDGQSVRMVYQRIVSPRPVNAVYKKYAIPAGLMPVFQNMRLTRQPRLIPCTTDDPAWIELAEPSGIASYVGIPIKVKGEVIGVLNLNSGTPCFFTPEHVERLQVFADQAAVAIENAQLYAESRHHATELQARIAERTRELEQERAELQIILDTMAEGVLHFGAETGKILYINRAFARMLGYSQEEILTQAAAFYREANANPDFFDATAPAIRRALAQGETWQGELKVRRRDASIIDVGMTVTAVPGPDGAPVGGVALIRDIAQEKALQAQKDRFIASASHELRTPVTNLKMRVYLARNQPERLAEHLDIIESTTQHMTNLIENLLDLSRFERGVIVLNRQDVVLQELIKLALADQQPRAREKAMELVEQLPADPIRIQVDPDRIRQVIDNLIVNAINYTPERGQVEVRLFSETRDNAPYAVVQVKDNGIGIAPEALSRVFESFYQASDNKVKGIGLGLTISKEIVLLHHGDIQVTSRTGEGSTFSLWLPLEPQRP